MSITGAPIGNATVDGHRRIHIIVDLFLRDTGFMDYGKYYYENNVYHPDYQQLVLVGI